MKEKDSTQELLKEIYLLKFEFQAWKDSFIKHEVKRLNHTWAAKEVKELHFDGPLKKLLSHEVIEKLPGLTDQSRSELKNLVDKIELNTFHI